MLALDIVILFSLQHPSGDTETCEFLTRRIHDQPFNQPFIEQSYNHISTIMLVLVKEIYFEPFFPSNAYQVIESWQMVAQKKRLKLWQCW